MADDVKRVANDVIEDVMNDLPSGMKKAAGDSSEKACQRSLLCILFTPCTYLRKFNSGNAYTIYSH